MSDYFDPLGLADNFVLQIQNLVDGNQVSRDDVEKIYSEVIDVNFDINVLWNFYGKTYENRTAGGSAVAEHFDYNQDRFEQHTQYLLEISQYDQNQRQDFISHIIEQQKQSLVLADSDQKIHDFPEFSYYETCSECSGKGKVRCSGCGGSGVNSCCACGGGGTQIATRTVYEYYNGQPQPRTQTYSKSCSGCGGSGRHTCGSCGGSGQITCKTCQGHGYFTTIRRVSLYAHPKYEIEFNTPAFEEEVSEFMKSLSKVGSFIVEKTDCELLGHKSSSQEYEIFSYHSATFLCSLEYKVLDKQYFGLAISNPPLPFIKANIFDDLFADEIAELKKIGYDGKITHKEAFGFFTKYLWQPVLERSLKDIAHYREAKNDNFTNVIMTHCDGYISSNSASYFSNMINNMLDKISPAYSIVTWLIGGIIFALITFFFAELIFESTIKYTPIFSTIMLLIIFVVSCFVVGITLSLLSSIVVFIKRRKIPKEYRQSMRNKEAYYTMLKFSVLSLILGIIFGLTTLKFPQIKLVNHFHAIVQKLDKNYGLCHKLEPVCIFANGIKQASDNDKRQINNKKQTKILTKRDKVIFIQKELIKHGYKIKADGKFGAKTITAAQKHLNKKVSNIDEIYKEMQNK